MDSDKLALFKTFKNEISSLEKRGVIVKDITFDPEGLCYIFLYSVDKTDNDLALTPRQQTIWSNKIKAISGYPVSFMALPAIDQFQTESGIAVLLKKLYDNNNIFAYITIEGNNMRVMIDGIGSIESSEREKQKINQCISRFIEDLAFKISSIEILGVTNRMPSKMEILNIIKILAPCSLSEIREKFVAKNYSTIPDRWLSGQLSLYLPYFN